MTESTNTNVPQTPLLLTAKQAAKLLGVSIYTFNQLVIKKLIVPVEGFKKRRRYSERSILIYAWNLAAK